MNPKHQPITTIAELTQMPDTMEELLALSKKAQTEYKQRFYADLFAELDRVMPEIKMWGRDLFFYECRICGSVVKERVAHYRWHRGTDMLNVLTALFGRPN